jgi:hypothetical protein
MAVELRPSTAQARIPSLRGYRDRKSIVCVRRMWIDSSLLPALGPRVLLMLRQSACEKKMISRSNRLHGREALHVGCMVLAMESWTTRLPCQKQKKRAGESHACDALYVRKSRLSTRATQTSSSLYNCLSVSNLWVIRHDAIYIHKFLLNLYKFICMLHVIYSIFPFANNKKRLNMLQFLF